MKRPKSSLYPPPVPHVLEPAVPGDVGRRWVLGVTVFSLYWGVSRDLVDSHMESTVFFRKTARPRGNPKGFQEHSLPT